MATTVPALTAPAICGWADRPAPATIRVRAALADLRAIEFISPLEHGLPRRRKRVGRPTSQSRTKAKYPFRPTFPCLQGEAAAPLQEAIIPGLRFGQDYYDDLLAKYTHKRDLFCKGLDALGLVHNVPQGAYYVMMDISEFGYDSDLKFCEELAAKVGVGAVPGSSFFREPVNHLIRFHFAKKDETLNDALNRLEALRSKIPARAAR